MRWYMRWQNVRTRTLRRVICWTAFVLIVAWMAHATSNVDDVTGCKVGSDVTVCE